MPSERIQKLTVILIGIFLILGGRLWYLQFVKGDNFYRLAMANRERSIPQAAPRGELQDRTGIAIASNRIAYSVSVVPSGLNDPDGTITERLSDLLGLSVDDIHATIVKGSDFPYEPIVLLRDVPIETVIAVEERRNSLPGVFVEEEWVRSYPYGSLAGQILGFLGEADQNDLDNGYRPKEMLGKYGLESALEPFLRGEAGERRVEVNALSRAVRELQTIPPVRGMDVRLTIDLGLQLRAEQALAEGLARLATQAEKGHAGNGAVVVLDATTGGVLAMASVPSFDLAEMHSDGRSRYYNHVSNDPDRPMLNRALLAYPPGSVYKVVTGIAALESGAITPQTVYHATGYGPYGRRDWTISAGLPPAGNVTIVDALARSANDFFWDVVLRPEMDSEVMAFWARELGLGGPVGLPLIEGTGFIPSASLKRQMHDEPWYPLDSMNVAIGQGDILVTPMQVAMMYMTIANEGVQRDVYIVEEIVHSSNGFGGDDAQGAHRWVAKLDRHEKTVEAHPATWKAIKDGLRRVVQWEHGTAYWSFVGAPYDPAGKTGSAESALAAHAWFAGFAPAEDPEIVVVAFGEHGESGARLAPVVREIMDYYFLEQQ